MNMKNEAGSTDLPAPVREDSDLVQVLDAEGNVLPQASVPDMSDRQLLEMYETIKLARHFDQRAISFQRQGRLATCRVLGMIYQSVRPLLVDHDGCSRPIIRF